MYDAKTVEHVAAAIYEALYKGKYKDADRETRSKCRVSARTIISARMLGQSALDAAKRLATWYWVDKGEPPVPWEEADNSLKRVMKKIAKAGYMALGVKSDEKSDEKT